MSILNNDIQRVAEEFPDEEIDNSDGFCRKSVVSSGDDAPTSAMEAEKRIRREIANSNERRRMQSINAGFQSLRTLLPHHEGEKLSKAAILQQTAEYIYNLEQEKTRLLSQNCQLMRQVQQHEGGDVPPKKRKTEVIMGNIQTVQTVSESSDEGVGSMSPEPVGLVALSISNTNELNEIKLELERERSIRAHLEEQLRNLENQLYGQIQYPSSEMVELKEEPLDTQHIQEDEELDLQLVTPENLPPVAHTQTVVCSPQLSRSPSPVLELPPRLPSVLEAAIKAEPKVEVERLPSPTCGPCHDEVSCSRIYVNTSRQNLETIVEAIRHLEGDHLFSDEPSVRQPQQEVPLALTNKTQSDRMLKVEMNPYLHFRSSAVSTIQQQHQQQQSRPGVIVVKQHS